MEHPSPSSKMIPPPRAQALWWSFKLAFKLLSHTEYDGTEYMPPTGAVVMATNHLSYVDPPILYATMPRHNDIVVMVGDTYQKIFFYRFIVESVNSIWIKRGASDRAALKISLEVLARGNILGLAPEGTRSKTGLLQEGKPGAVFLATKANVPIVPVGISGTQHAFTELKRLRRPQMRVSYGRPFTLPPLEGDNKAALLESYTHEIMCRIAAQLPDEYHGFYAGNKRIAEIRELNSKF